MKLVKYTDQRPDRTGGTGRVRTNRGALRGCTGNTHFHKIEKQTVAHTMLALSCSAGAACYQLRGWLVGGILLFLSALVWVGYQGEE